MELKEKTSRSLAHHELLNKNKDLIIKAYDNLDPESCYKLANLLIGISDNPNREDYLYLLKIASDGNINQAQLLLVTYLINHDRLEESYDLYLRIYQNENQPPKVRYYGLTQASLLVYQGKIKDKDLSFTYQSFEKVYSYNPTDKDVLYALADMNLHGLGTDINKDKATKYFNEYKAENIKTLNVLYKDSKNLEEEEEELKN